MFFERLMSVENAVSASADDVVLVFGDFCSCPLDSFVECEVFATEHCVKGFSCVFVDEFHDVLLLFRSLLCTYIIPQSPRFVNRFCKSFFRFFCVLFCDNVCDYVVLDLFRTLIRKGDGHGRAGWDCVVKVAPYIAVGGDDVAAAAVDGGICAVLVTLLLDGGAGDHSQQDDE